MKKNLLRIITCMLVVAMALSVVPFGSLAGVDLGMTASAATAKSGKCGKNVSYSLDSNGVMTISGTGKMYDYNTSPFEENTSIKSVVIKKGVTSIGDRTFLRCKKLTSLSISNSVTSIGKFAFSGCSNLSNFTIPNSVTNIGLCSFEECTKLTKINVHDSVKYINDNAFSNCSKLKSISVSDKTILGSDVFWGTAWFKSKPNGSVYLGNIYYQYKGDYDSFIDVKIKDGTKAIAGGAFAEHHLSSVIIPDSVMSVGDYAFYCYTLATIEIPYSVTSIGEGALLACGLESVTVDERNRCYSSQDGALFNKNKSRLIRYPVNKDDTKYIIPNTVKIIENYAFSDSKYLTNIVIPNGVTSIGMNAFSDCEELKSISIPDSIKGISNYAFYHCRSLKSVTIPNGVKTIGVQAFSDCSELEKLIIGNGTTKIDKFAFFRCEKLKDVTIGKNVTSIGDETFSNCKKLTKITIPRSVSSLGRYSLGYENIIDLGVHRKIKNFIISGYKGTAAEKYAKENSFKFVALSEPKPVNIGLCTVTAAKSATYTGKATKPTLTVKNGKTTLKAGTHYTVSYKNNTKIGKATVTIKGVEKNGYTGTKTLTFNILPGVTKSLKATQSTSSIKLTWSKVAGATGYRVYRHDGKKWVKLADTKNTTYTVSKLKAGTNYKYAVKAYTTVGKTVYWSASFAQISTATKPATPAIKVTAGKKQAAVSWKKITGATGYVVYYSTSKNGEYRKLATVKGTSYTAKKLTTGKTYYFKVAAYKTVGKTNIYGSYSTATGAKIK